MKKRTACAAAMLFAAVSFTATTAMAAEYPVTVTDDLGNEVTLEAAPENIVSMAPVETEILFALGAGDTGDRQNRILQLSGRSDKDRYDRYLYGRTWS